MSSQEKQRQLRRVLIVTPLSIEMKAVQRYARSIQRWSPSAASANDYEVGEFKASGTHWEIVFKESGQRNTVCSVVTQQALTDTQPELAMLVGVAGGLRDVVPGDVVIPELIYDYASGKAGEQFQPRPRTFAPDRVLLEQARRLARDTAWQQWLPAPPERNPSVLCKPLAAGDILMHSRRASVYHFIRTYYDDAVAVAMEDAGFMEAAQYNRTPAIVVRAISDLLDDKSERDAQGYQEQAANHASAFAFALLASGLPPLGNGCANSSAPRPVPASDCAALALLQEDLPHYEEELKAALSLFSTAKTIYPGQCRHYKESLDKFATAVQQAIGKLPDDYALSLRLANLGDALLQLQQAAERLRQCCPPGESSQEQRAYQQALRQICQALQKVLTCLEHLHESLDRRPP
ncbi:5'-methylthioadenosine/S-adenosylhomocysteine nucleosidase [Thermogemmatispora carboxidivorans]|uniref:5'-methylthioadenosine/S-adenosylhomocysteine nucleosidase family protein n=1 Tax=Thermogemmatispora carboxidivorans TaxID=1382306 RepID=UPI00069C5B46|nr:5'-methylthioadenosine/S-adenosylhomocysteine nucleosidase [Thermogemmatispora carboxidivorans]